MAHDSQLPCDGEGVCMLCKTKPSSQDQIIICTTCTTPWHLSCLSPPPPETLLSSPHWECPDCSPISGHGRGFNPVGRDADSCDLIASVREIEADESLSEREKAKKRQRLMSRGRRIEFEETTKEKSKKDVMDLFDENFNCSFCMKLPERPVTTPCGHNFCLKCFQKWIGQGKRSCAKCRMCIPNKMAKQPHINSSLVVAIRMAKISKSISSEALNKVYHFVHNQQLPEKAFTTERAKRTGKANACSGKIFVTVPPDHFGPIGAENDPKRNQGVLVGECWEDRMECRQWGVHLPHIAGISGQSDYGAQSVALSGGYEDDEDHGEWFLYTGSGGRDLSGNKRTNKVQSFDQKFEKKNEALRVSCKKGYPVRVVRGSFRRNVSCKVGKWDRVRFWEDVWIGERALCTDYGDFYAMSDRKNQPVKKFTVVKNGITSWDIDLRQAFNDWEIDGLATLLGRLGPPPLLSQEEDKQVSVHDSKGHFAATSWSNKVTRSSYAPEKGVRYDGVYRIEKCWRKIGVQGFKVCRYLFVRCDNEPAPWTSDEYGDRPRPLPIIKELKGATDVTEREDDASWDYDEEDGCWKWKKPPPLTRRSLSSKNPEDGMRARKASRQVQNLSVRERLLKEFSCLICKKVLNLPLTTPCAHNFCKACLEEAFCGQTFFRDRTFAGWRTLRAQKNVMKCPACPNDISDFLKNPQISRELMGMIDSLQHKAGEENVESSSEEESFGTDEHSETEGEEDESQMQDAIKVKQNRVEHKFEQVYKRRKVDAEVLVSKSDDLEITELYFKEKETGSLCECMEDEKMSGKRSGTKRQDDGRVARNFIGRVYKRRKVNVEALSTVPSDIGNLSGDVKIESLCGGMEEMRVEDSLTERKDDTEGVHDFWEHKSERVYKWKVDLDVLLLKPSEIVDMDNFTEKENIKPLHWCTKDELVRAEDNEIQRPDSPKVVQKPEGHEQDCKWRKTEDSDLLSNPGNSEPKSEGEEGEEMEGKSSESNIN